MTHEQSALQRLMLMRLRFHQSLRGSDMAFVGDGFKTRSGERAESLDTAVRPRSKREKRMRATLCAMLVALGVGLVGTANVSAAPLNGAAIGDAAMATDMATQVQHWRWGSGGPRRSHWRWGSAGPR